MSDLRVPEDRPAKAAAQFLDGVAQGILDKAVQGSDLRIQLADAEKRAAAWEKHANMLKADLVDSDAALRRLGDQAQHLVNQLDAAKASAVELEPLSGRAQAVADTRARLAYLMRAELVCCDIYREIAGPLDAMHLREEATNRETQVADHKAAQKAFRARLKAAKADGSYHAICYYGEWSARLCETGKLPEGDLDYILTRWKGTWSTSPAGGRSPSDGSAA